VGDNGLRDGWGVLCVGGWEWLEGLESLEEVDAASESEPFSIWRSPSESSSSSSSSSSLSPSSFVSASVLPSSPDSPGDVPSGCSNPKPRSAQPHALDWQYNLTFVFAVTTVQRFNNLPLELIVYV
jgi:hypothetical protein